MGEIIWMPIAVALRRTTDGEERIYLTNGTRDEAGEFEAYIWEEGNFACDCNRYDFFEYAAGRDQEDFEEESAAVSCGDDEFVILWIRDLETDEIVYSECLAIAGETGTAGT